MQRLSKRNIHVKRFDDIPMADTEMIFPDKRVYVKPIVLIQLLVTVILGLVAAVTTFFSVTLQSVSVRLSHHCMWLPHIMLLLQHAQSMALCALSHHPHCEG